MRKAEAEAAAAKRLAKEEQEAEEKARQQQKAVEAAWDVFFVRKECARRGKAPEKPEGGDAGPNAEGVTKQARQDVSGSPERFCVL